MESLSINHNDLAELDLSGNPELRWLYIYHTNISELDLSNNTKLYGVNLQSNRLTSLIFGSHPSLWTIDCSVNRLTKLDLRNIPDLQYLYCYKNPLTDLDVSWSFRLNDLIAFETDLTKLDIRNCILLETLVRDKDLKVRKEQGEYGEILYFGKMSYEELGDDFIRITDGQYRTIDHLVLKSEEKLESLYDPSDPIYEIEGEALIIHGNFYFQPLDDPTAFMDGKREFTKLRLSDTVKITLDDVEGDAKAFNERRPYHIEVQIKDGVVTEIIAD